MKPATALDSIFKAYKARNLLGGHNFLTSRQWSHCAKLSGESAKVILSSRLMCCAVLLHNFRTYILLCVNKKRKAEITNCLFLHGAIGSLPFFLCLTELLARKAHFCYEKQSRHQHVTLGRSRNFLLRQTHNTSWQICVRSE